MAIWHSALSAPVELLRFIAALFRGEKETEAHSPSPPAGNSSIPPEKVQESSGLQDNQDPKFGLAVALLTKVRVGLSEHSDEMATFASALAPEKTFCLQPESRARMLAANLSLEELVESTVQRLKQLSGNHLLAEQTQLEKYQRATNDLDRRINEIPAELVMTHVVAELLGKVQELRHENEAVRSEMAEAQKKLCQLAMRATVAEKEARIDPLTQLLNRRAFDEAHDACHAASQDCPYCLVLIDIDRFKSINDQYGHAAGDAVLALIARAMRENTRGTERIARWGGEEFAILLAATSPPVALGVAERMRRKVEATILHIGTNRIRFTVSCGVVQSRPGATMEETLEEADLALIAAKRQGRNRSVVYDSSLGLPEPEIETEVDIVTA